MAAGLLARDGVGLSGLLQATCNVDVHVNTRVLIKRTRLPPLSVPRTCIADQRLALCARGKQAGSAGPFETSRSPRAGCVCACACVVCLLRIRDWWLVIDGRWCRDTGSR